ncbi:HTH-type transcriptional regulator ImmR [Lactobacillus helveticus]|uniref:helix-turn-helix domain-containing protein n=1 Tax=Lactobacillus helveticus TaxID=1587 RepID=UPI0019FBB34B|nr:helix-turn-helix transcriptional regulator [Lactobacillus helveticus]NRN80157.1 HTH-type transcriptional regulator ImmR [Lactobacillus helveticus]NRO23690.1 HTH-type transcriptional regulator ImmR [Lactobacillus helveticus]
MQNRLKELRQKNNLTLKELGQKVGMANNTLSQYETGKREPKLETWKKLADFFDVPVSYLQGFGLSNEQAINIAWDWAYSKRSYEKHPMNKLLEAFFKEYCSREEIKEIFKNKQSFAHFMNKRFKSVFNYYSLSKMKNQDDLERTLAMCVGASTKYGVYDSVIAQLDSVDFKNDSDERIHEVLEGILTDIFMYIDKVK